MDYRERQRSQFVRASGLQKLMQKFGLSLHLEMVDVHLRFRLNRIKTCELCPCAIIYKLHVEYYPITLSTVFIVYVSTVQVNDFCIKKFRHFVQQ